MFCSRCGFKNPDNGNFCQHCGAPISMPTRTTPKHEQTLYSQSKETFRTNQTQNQTGSQRQTASIITKKTAASPLFLTAIIAYTIAAFFSFIGATNSVSSVAKIIYSVCDTLNIPTHQINDLIDIVTIVFPVFFVILTLIPITLTAVGLWITYCSAVRKNHARLDTSGLTIIKVITVIRLVFIAIFTALLVIEFALLFSIAIMENSPEATMAAFLLLLIFVLTGAVLTLTIIFNAKIISSINAAKNAAIADSTSKKVSSFVAVFSFIIAGLSLFSIATFNIIQMSYAIFSIISNICFGAVLLVYKSKINSLLNPPVNQPTYNFSTIDNQSQSNAEPNITTEQETKTTSTITNENASDKVKTSTNKETEKEEVDKELSNIPDASSISENITKASDSARKEENLPSKNNSDTEEIASEENPEQK